MTVKTDMPCHTTLRSTPRASSFAGCSCLPVQRVTRVYVLWPFLRSFNVETVVAIKVLVAKALALELRSRIAAILQHGSSINFRVVHPLTNVGLAANERTKAVLAWQQQQMCRSPLGSPAAAPRPAEPLA
jgi:hypothetical protein